MDRRTRIDLIIGTLSRLGFPAILRRFQKEEFCILMLHGITDQREQSGIGNTEGISIHVDDFEAICGLLSECYHVPSLDEVIESMATGNPLPPSSVVLTFDDGYESDYKLAFPILKKYGLPGTVFVATDFVHNKSWMWWDRMEYAVGHSKEGRLSIILGDSHFDRELGSKADRTRLFLDLLPVIKGLPQELIYNQIGRIESALGVSLADAGDPPEMYRPMNWDQAREMLDSGLISIGGHTHTHRILGRCTLETARHELETCQQLLAENLGLTNPLFSYTNGRVGDFTDETNELVKELGYRCALTTETGFNRVEDDPYLLRRFSTGNNFRYVDVVASGALQALLDMTSGVRGRNAAVW